MPHIKFIKSIEASDESVVNGMSEYLHNNRGFAKEICNLLNDYFYDWACELVDTNDGTEFFIDNNHDKIFDDSCKDWSSQLSEITDTDDYHYSLYYRMCDFNYGTVTNSVPLIIEHYLRLKLGLL